MKATAKKRGPGRPAKKTAAKRNWVYEHLGAKPKSKKQPEVLPALLAALTGFYGAMPLAPGVCVSQLENGEWYASVARFVYGADNKIKRVVTHKSVAKTLDEAIVELARNWYRSSQPVVQLGRIMAKLPKKGGA